MTDDDRLMIRLQEGDPQAFDTIVERHQGPLYGFFFYKVRDAQFAEDLTQDTLLKVYNQAWDYLPTGRFRGWMYRIGHNLMIDKLRRHKRDALVRAVKGPSDDEEHDAMARIACDLLPPDERASHRELACIIDEHIARLPEEQRLTFVLHHYNGLTLGEIADVLETSVPTTKSRMRLAREKLQEHLKRSGVTDRTSGDTS